MSEGETEADYKRREKHSSHIDDKGGNMTEQDAKINTLKAAYIAMQLNGYPFADVVLRIGEYGEDISIEKIKMKMVNGELVLIIQGASSDKGE